MKMNNGEYYVGFDIGTNSVGWAVTDLQYKILKFNGHKMWGVRLFDEAQTAETRRGFRSARRRQARKVARIKLLQEIFAEEIYKVDPGFYQRLEDSKFYAEDKSETNKYALFADNEYTDKNFHKDFPTIYHLRSELMRGEKQFDVRLVYLAIHHIIKSRGHFLYQGEKFDLTGSFDEIMREIFANSDVFVENIDVSEKFITDIKGIVLESRMTKRDKKNKIKEIIGESKQLESIFGLAIGSKESLANLFACEEYAELESDVTKISFSESVYEEKRDSYEEILEERIILLDSIKKIYDMMILSGIKKEGVSISDSKIELFEKHKKELKELKKLIKVKLPEEYVNIFSLDEEKGSNYKNYIGNAYKKCTRDDFYKYIKKTMEKIEDCKEKNEILKEIELNQYLPLQRVKENGVIPYQVHEAELSLILENASEYLELLNREENGITVKEKIRKIMTFRIPYYVGPINTTHSEKEGGFAWAVKRSNEKITPWNFEDVVDLESSHEKFIAKLTNKCTYLKGEDVIPKNSLIYSEFTLLNELNNLKCDGQAIPVDVRDSIIDYFFKNCDKKSKVTVKKIADFLRGKGYIEGTGTITGIDIEVKADLKSYRDFKRILGNKFDFSMVENIVRYITLYGNEIKSLKKRIKTEYGDVISDEEIIQICKLKYKDWGRFSKAFLTEIISEEFTDYSTGEVGSIINALRNTNLNLMQLLSNQYGYMKEVTKRNEKIYGESEELSYEMLDDLYASPPVKRMIRQTLLLMDEIKKITGMEPKKIFIETTRSAKAIKKRTDSRKRKLIELYSCCKNEERDWANEIENLDDSVLRSKKLYLYYLQMGKCMYTNEKIDIGKLMSKEYDIDHIYPQSKTKDDSFDNLVLVTKVSNYLKSDEYPVKIDVQEKMKSTWDYLLHKKLMSPIKYNRLTRKTGFEPQELADFINRQLVETSQSTKATAEILNRWYKNSRIVYVKGENVSEFRKKNDFIKIRELNDFHHAHDAYLNIVVGNVYDTKFTSSPINFIKDVKFREYNLNRMFQFNVERSGYTAWDAEHNKSIETVKNQMRSRDIRITRKVSEQKGQLFDQTIYKKDKCKPNSYIGTKKSDERLADVKKYGGYTSIKIAYLLSYGCDIVDKKGKVKHVNRLIGVPIHAAKNIKTKQDASEFIMTEISRKEDEKVINLNVVDIKLRIGTVISYNGFKYFVGGRTGDNFCADNAIQLSLSKEGEYYLKELTRFSSKKKTDKNLTLEKSGLIISREKNEELYNELVNKMGNNIYSKALEEKYIRFSDEGIKKFFMDLESSKQIDILFDILNLLTNKKTTYDFSALGFNYARRKIGFNLAEVKEIEVINQSITGLFENRINLLVEA